MDSSSIWDVLPENISRPSIEKDEFWGTYGHQAKNPTIHLAILSPTYLELILKLDKTIESRFSLYRRLPYERVNIGDVILLKQTSGPIRGIAYVDNVWFYKLENGTLDYIKERYGEGMRIQDEAFWLRCEQLSYATLIKLTHVKRISPIRFSKKDRNAWTVFSPQTSL